jgi:hypothetical protein
MQGSFAKGPEINIWRRLSLVFHITQTINYRTSFGAILTGGAFSQADRTVTQEEASRLPQDHSQVTI